jgi:transposase
MQIARIGLDLAKYVFEIHGVDAHGKTVVRSNDWQKMAKRSLRRFPNLVSGPAWLRPMPWRR